MGTILGTSGDDTLYATGGDDTVNAGDGQHDLLIIDYSHIGGNFASTGVGQMSNGAGTSVSAVNVELFDITMGAGNDTVITGDGDDTVSGGAGNDNIDTGSGHATVNGGSGNDFWHANLTAFNGPYTFDAALTGTQNIGNGFQVTSIEGLDIASGNGDDRFLTYDNGFNDTIYAGGGNDTVQVGGNTAAASGDDYANGNDGTDDLLIINYGNKAGNFVSDGSTLTNHAGTSVASFNFEHYDITLGAGDDSIVTGGGDDTVIAGAGNDSIDTGQGHAVVDGGTGNDFWHADLSAFSGPYTFDAAKTGTQNIGNGFQVTSIEGLDISSGNGNDKFLTHDNGFNDTIFGGGGDDTIEVGGGADSVNGGNNASAGDLVVVDYSNKSGNFSFNGPVLGNGAGTSVTLVNFERYEIHTGSGDDTISGDNQSDTLDGGTGADSMTGGSGNDVYWVDNVGDQVVETSNGGTDTVYASASWALGAGQSVEVLATIDRTATGAISLTGNEIGQTLLGNAGANVLDGAGGVDTMYGYGGNDAYHVDVSTDRVVEAANAGTDTVYASASFILQAGQSVEVISTSSNAAATAINLTGNQLAQTLTGNAGANILDGGGGGDTLYGYGGNDNYKVESSTDKVIEATGNGSDTVYAGASWTLGTGQSVEAISTTSSAATTAINLTGNELSQAIYGNAGANTLSGLGGNDYLIGNAGNDRLVGGAGSDTMDGGAGNDVFAYTAVSDSTGVGRDLINNINFAQDKFDFTGTVTSIHAAVTSGSLSTATFDHDLGAIFSDASGHPTTLLGVHQAVLFTPDAGDLHASGDVFLIVDANGVAGYQSGADFVIELHGATGTLTLGDFS